MTEVKVLLNAVFRMACHMPGFVTVLIVAGGFGKATNVKQSTHVW